jgi:hypothetical protein
MQWIAIKWFHHAWYSAHKASIVDSIYLDSWAAVLRQLASETSDLSIALVSIEKFRQASELNPSSASKLAIARTQRFAARLAGDEHLDIQKSLLQGAEEITREVLADQPACAPAYKLLEALRVATHSDALAFRNAVDALRRSVKVQLGSSTVSSDLVTHLYTQRNQEDIPNQGNDERDSAFYGTHNSPPIPRTSQGMYLPTPGARI